MGDALLRFLFRGAPVRGEIVQLQSTWQQVIAHHRYPQPVLQLLGEMTAAAALLAATIKFNGTLILQIQGDGPVPLLVVENQPGFALRATAKLRPGDAIDPDSGLQTLVNPGGNGRCAITLDPRDPQPRQQSYQGIVPLVGDSIGAVLESYLRQSEQLESRLWLSADSHSAGGLLLQQLPEEAGPLGTNIDADAWNRLTYLAATVKAAELRSLAPDQVAHRLFWQETLDYYAPITPRFQCTCTRERIGRMLVSLGRDEVDSIIQDAGLVEVTCDFCNKSYQFDPIDVTQLFVAGSVAGSTGRQN